MALPDNPGPPEPPAERGNAARPLRRRIADCLGSVGKAVAISGAAVGLLALARAAAAGRDGNAAGQEYSPWSDRVDDGTRGWTNYPGGADWSCDHSGCSKKVNRIITDHDCCGRCRRGRECERAAYRDFVGAGGFPHRYCEGVLYPDECAACREPRDGHWEPAR